MILYNDKIFLECKSREEIAKALLLHPDAHLANPKTPEEFERVRLSYRQMYQTKDIFKNRSKKGLRYIVASYAVPAQNVLHITFDTSRISSSVRLGKPNNVEAKVAYRGCNTSIQMAYNFDKNSLIATCQSIQTCISLTTVLYPLEVRVDSKDIAGIIRSYTGKSWVINELRKQLDRPDIWLSYGEEIL